MRDRICLSLRSRFRHFVTSTFGSNLHAHEAPRRPAKRDSLGTLENLIPAKKPGKIF